MRKINSILISAILIILLIPSLSISDSGIKNKVKEIARDGRFIAYSNSTVLDTKTGLMWASKDNGKDINWQDAKRYCENYRGGGYNDWRMPTLDELKGTYDNIKENRYDIHLTKKFIDISACCPWALETRGSLAARFNFYYGLWNWACQSGSLFTRALPVRSCN